jgi:glycosyltransferase involved in cell wall biosynthesis
MKKLIFVCEWAKDRETSWSGTNNSIFQRLRNDYDLIDFDIGIRKQYTFVTKACQKLKLISQKKAFSLRQNHFGRKLARDYSYDIPCFEFGEHPHNEKRLSFCYQDLSILYVKHMKEKLPDIYKVSNYENIQEDFLDYWVENQRKFYQNPNTIVFTMGEWLRKWLISERLIDPSRVFTVGGGYNLDASKIHPNRNGKTFLFIGKDGERKGLPLVLDAFAKIRKKQNYTLIVAGPERMKSIPDGVIFKGRVPFSQLPELYNTSDVFVMPSLFEAYGLVFAEALTYGLPCIGRNAYEMPYFIEQEKTGYLLKENNSDELAELMEKAIQNQEMKQRVFEKKEEFIERYSWDSVVKRMEKIMNTKI